MLETVYQWTSWESPPPPPLMPHSEKMSRRFPGVPDKCRNVSKLLRITASMLRLRLQGSASQLCSFSFLTLKPLVIWIHSVPSIFPVWIQTDTIAFFPFGFSNFLCSWIYRFVILKRMGGHRQQPILWAEPGKDVALPCSCGAGFAIHRGWGTFPSLASPCTSSLPSSTMPVSPAFASCTLWRGQMTGVAWESRTQSFGFLSLPLLSSDSVSSGNSWYLPLLNGNNNVYPLHFIGLSWGWYGLFSK